MKPKIYETEKGKKYFLIHGKLFYFNEKLSKKKLLMIYKMLKKKYSPIKKSKSVTNTAKAIVNINQQPPRRQRRQRKRRSQQHVMQEDNTKNHIIVGNAGVKTTNSNLEDLNNKLINESVKKTLELELAKRQRNNNPQQNEQTPPSQQNPNQNQLIDESEMRRLNRMTQFSNIPGQQIDLEQGRIDALISNPLFIKWMKNPNRSEEEGILWLKMYNLTHLLKYEPKPKPKPGVKVKIELDKGSDKQRPILEQLDFSSPSHFQDESDDADDDISKDEETVKPPNMSDEMRKKESPDEEHLADFGFSKPNIEEDLTRHIFILPKNYGDPPLALSTPRSETPKPPKAVKRATPEKKTPKPETPKPTKTQDELLAEAIEARIEARNVFSDMGKFSVYKTKYNKMRNEKSNRKKKLPPPLTYHEWRIKEIKEGRGLNNNEDGLYDDEIDRIMSRYHNKGYLGSIMRDEIKTLLPKIKPQSRVSFIMNTDKSDKPGKHWVAVYIDGRSGPESSNSIEYYDSFANPIPHDVLADIKLIVQMIKPENLLKLKVNNVVHQSDDSSNCGFFACRFIIDRYRGQSFSSATGYDDRIKINHINKNEKEIEHLKKLPPFNYI